MAYASAVFVCVTFVVLIKILGVTARPFEVAAISKQAYRVLADPALHDDAKEAAMRQHAKTLVRLFVLISGGSLVALGVPLGIVWVLDAMGLLSLGAVFDALLSWPLLAGGIMVFVAKLGYDRVRPHGVR